VRVFVLSYIMIFMPEKVSIYIDGGNFYHLVLKKLGVLEVDFDFDSFAIFLANKREISKMGKGFMLVR